MAEIRQVLKDNLKFYRHGAGLTQQKLAEACGVTTPYIGEIEIGRRFVSLQLIETLARVLKIEPWQLLFPQDARVHALGPMMAADLKGSVVRAVEDVIDRAFLPRIPDPKDQF